MYEDVDEIKTKLHNAYMKACDTIGEGVPCSEVVAFESVDLKFVVKIEKVIMADIVQIQNPKSHMWTLINRDTGTILEHSDGNTQYTDVAILGEYETMSHKNTRLVFGYNCIKTGHILRKECLKSVSLCPECGSMIKSFVFKVKKQGAPQ